LCAHITLCGYITLTPFIRTANTTRLQKLHVSPRFRATVVRAVLKLEENAAKDERRIPVLSDTGHKLRQARLVPVQLDRAFHLREFLQQLTASCVQTVSKR
jgi:hypothetical protein